jgi:hypothetical protein
VVVAGVAAIVGSDVAVAQGCSGREKRGWDSAVVFEMLGPVSKLVKKWWWPLSTALTTLMEAVRGDDGLASGGLVVGCRLCNCLLTVVVEVVTEVS